MPIGHNISSCIHCGCEILRGDARLALCDACSAAGHRDAPGGCPACAATARMRRARIDAIIAQSTGMEPLTSGERHRRERTRAALAESRAALEAGAVMASFDRWLAVPGPAIDERGNFTPEVDDEYE